MKILETRIKWLGYEYNTNADYSGIPNERQEGFKKLRSPKSLAELNSRLGAFSYFSSYIPNLKKLSSALFTLTKSEKFIGGNWNQNNLKT